MGTSVHLYFGIIWQKIIPSVMFGWVGYSLPFIDIKPTRVELISNLLCSVFCHGFYCFFCKELLHAQVVCERDGNIRS